MSDVQPSLSLADSGSSTLRPFTRLLAASGLLFLLYAIVGQPTFQAMTSIVISVFLLGAAAVVHVTGADRVRPGVRHFCKAGQAGDSAWGRFCF